MNIVRYWAALLTLAGFSMLGACQHHSPQADNALQSLYDQPITTQSNGQRLAILMCAGCHYNQQDDALSGARLNDLPWYVGEVWSANLTRGASGINAYTEPALAEMIRSGRMLNGKVSPFMGTPQISSRDLQQIIEFLQSEHRLLRPINRNPPKSKLSWISRLYLMINPVRAKVQVNNDQAPEAGSRAQHGEYLVAILDCYGCHSKSLAGVNRQSPATTMGYMAGGARMTGTDGTLIRSANLTPDTDSGIGGWNASEFVAAMRSGTRPDGLQLRPPMPRYSQLSTHELESIFAYLRTLQPVRNPVRRNF